MASPAPSPAGLRLALFGPPTLTDAYGAVPLALKRAYALLAYLALAPRPVPRDEAAELLWPEATLAVSRTRLRRLIYQVEQAGGEDLIDTQSGTLSPCPRAVACDLLGFQAQARTLVGGGTPGVPLADLEAMARDACAPLMQGLAFGSQAFDDWAAQQRVDHQHLLARLLMRLAQLRQARGELDKAADSLELLLAQDPYNEPAYVLRMQLAAQAHDAAGVESVFSRCADALRAEFGCKPAARTEAAYLAAQAQVRSAAAPAADEAMALDVRFAPGPQGAVAYARLGSGSEAVVVMPGFISHIEIGWEHPGMRRTVGELARRYTVLVFDRRGLGLSERLHANGTVESTAADVLTVLDHAGIARAWLFGSSEGAPAAIHLAARHPARVAGLALFGGLAKGCRSDDYPWALSPAAFDRWMESLVATWGGPADLATFAPSVADDPWTRAWWARMLRHAATPASLRTVLAGLRDADVRPLLPAITQPALVLHRRDDHAVRLQAGEFLARGIPGARWEVLEGTDHFWWVGEGADRVAGRLARFIDTRD